MADRMRIRGRTALITGAGSGIGRALALNLARRGASLALADINLARAEETARDAAGFGVTVTAHQLDVADPAAIEAFPAVFGQSHRRLDLLFNNAGVALGGTFDQVEAADFDWLMSINFFGVVRMTRAFLPRLQESDDARLVNVSSIFGILAPPGQAAYVSSKFAVRGFSNSLRHELAGTSVGVTVVHPGGVATSIASDARVSGSLPPEEVEKRRRDFQKFLKLSPEAAAETIVRAVERRQARVIVGNDAKIAALVERLVPVGYWALIGKSAS